MSTDFDSDLSANVCKLLVEAPSDIIELITGESRLAGGLRALPWPSLKSTINTLSHYASMGYIHKANELGLLPGVVSWDHPTPGNDILEWKHGGQTYKFRRTNDENEMPDRSGHVRKSERHNAQQGFLFSPEVAKDATGEIHWLICSGFQDGPRLADILEARFFVWTAPFLASDHRMIGSRKMLYSGTCAELLKPVAEATHGVEISKPILSQKDKQEAINEAFKKISGE